ncbi:AraC family transcriptional regulator [Vibrio diabolicus]|uniref:AraC family transcriptional regulator n=1 Tax=Vibrio diabolicus TaxID=50719 RepID=UPI00159460BE|nr:helix-turn-helix domain-containing protein [Vibrio diabolicus]NVC51715.1 helix-turn-helix domain-containing protein [Vibrio diabolicus]
MLRQLALVLLGFFLSFQAFALHNANAIFYPLPTQVKGTFIAAKKLFLGEQGGLWIHDVHGRVLFYDGQNILPKSGSFLQMSAKQLAYHEGSFWTFVENEVYQTYPNQERRLVFSLNPGSQIRKIGSSEDYIWVSDGAHFYTYNIDTSELKSFSLLQLYQHSNNSYVYINDAVLLEEKWALATTSGFYLSEGDKFDHVVASGQNYIEKIYYSHTRREILVGTLRGALIFNIYQPDKEVIKIGGSHVLTFAETNQEYWVGTEHGLYLYSFLSGEVTEVEPASFLELELDNTKIYSLLSDNMGGMWIATNQGIRYYSLFSKKFERVTFSSYDSQTLSGRIRQTSTGPDDALWFADDRKLYRTGESGNIKVLELDSQINEFAFQGGMLWLATSKGLEIFELNGLNKVTFPYLQVMAGHAVEHVTVDGNDRLWVSSGYHLYNVDITKQSVRNFGSEWLVSQYLPAKVTRLYDTEDSLLIGTDHGVYQYSNENIQFIRYSEKFGESLDMVTAVDGSQWFASSYGVFKTIKGSDEKHVVEMSVPNARPACLIRDRQGVWLASSVGLSYYHLSGELVKHYSSASGLMNNEFLPGICSVIQQKEGGERELVLGSKYGLVKAEASKLLVSNPPESKFIVSQVVLENEVLQVGSADLNGIKLPYGSSLSFLFGVMPKPDSQNLYYRLNSDDPWQALEGGQLTLEHLNSGEYHLQVSNESQVAAGLVGLESYFIVLNPWYLSQLAILGFVVASIAMVALLMYWRSRYVVQANRDLAAQVTLKTNQLRHQSRVLLTSNQQLRKQIQVRNLLVDHVAQSIKSSVDFIAAKLPIPLDAATEDHLAKTTWQLNELKSVPSEASGGSHNYNLSQITQSVVDVWQDDFAKAGIMVELEDERKTSRIALESFNLDVIFNSIFANIIKRSFRGQTVRIMLEQGNDIVSLSFLDYGTQLPNKVTTGRPSNMNHSELSIDHLAQLVTTSGGYLAVFTSDAQNKIEITWPTAKEMSYVDESLQEFESEPIVEDKVTPEKEWLQKVYQLVAEHYHDPEFGTALAAKMLFMSERSLQRRFKSASSRTLKDYVTEVRLETACEQLLAGEKISEVAFNCGFNDPSYFSQKFKLHFGLPPSKFALTQESQESQETN